MNIKFGQTAIVLDENDNYVEFVVMCSEDGSETLKPYKYTLQAGEHLLFDVPLPSSDMCIKHWTGTEWEEAASNEQLARWEAERNAEQLPTVPSIDERLAATEAFCRELLMGGVRHV